MSKEIAERIELAVESVNSKKKLGYEKLAEFIKKTALKFNISETTIRAVSGIHLKPIKEIISQWDNVQYLMQFGGDDLNDALVVFNGGYDKLGKTDKARVDKIIKEKTEINHVLV